MQQRRCAVHGSRLHPAQHGVTVSRRRRGTAAARTARANCDSPRARRLMEYVLLQARGGKASVCGAGRLRAQQAAGMQHRAGAQSAPYTHSTSDSPLTARSQIHVVRAVQGAWSRSSGGRRAGAAKNARSHHDRQHAAHLQHGRCTTCSTDLRLTSRSHAPMVRAVERVRPRSSATRHRQPASTAQPKIEGSAGVESRTLHALEQRCATHLALSDPYCTCCRGRAVEKQCAPSGRLRKTAAHTAQRNGRDAPHALLAEPLL